VLLNDSDPDGDLNPLSVTIVDGPNGSGKKGTLTVTPVAGQDIVFYDAPNDRGTVTFRYQVCDTAKHCSTAEGTITVN
jgi:Bacterial Ig domain